MDTDLFLIYSNQKGMWWRPDHSGYTPVIDEAGRYPRAEAEKIVASATCDGALRHERTDPVTGVSYVYLDEVAVLAPESTEAAW